MRAVYLASSFRNYFGTIVNELQSPKAMICNVYFLYFEKSFDIEMCVLGVAAILPLHRLWKYLKTRL